MWYSFTFLFYLHRHCHFISNSAGVSRIAEDAYPKSAPGECSKVMEESKLLICFCFFACVTSLSLNYIRLISAGILVAKITVIHWKCTIFNHFYGLFVESLKFNTCCKHKSFFYIFFLFFLILQMCDYTYMTFPGIDECCPSEKKNIKSV